MDRHQSSNIQSCSAVSKFMIKLLRHDKNIFREDDGAVRFDDLVGEFKVKFVGTLQWTVDAWVSWPIHSSVPSALELKCTRFHLLMQVCAWMEFALSLWDLVIEVLDSSNNQPEKSKENVQGNFLHDTPSRKTPRTLFTLQFRTTILYHATSIMFIQK